MNANFPISRRLFALGATGIAWLAGRPATAAISERPREKEIGADDKLAIIELMARYAWCYDGSDPAGFAATFTPDGVIEVFGNEAARGRDAMAPFLQTAYAMRKNHGWQHLTDHHVFQDFDGQSCTVYSYYLMPECDADGGNGSVRAMGYYVSYCVKNDNKWLFAKRAIFRWNGKKPWSDGTG